jgi:hypothetical protein
MQRVVLVVGTLEEELQKIDTRWIGVVSEPRHIVILWPPQQPGDKYTQNTIAALFHTPFSTCVRIFIVFVPQRGH